MIRQPILDSRFDSASVKIQMRWRLLLFQAIASFGDDLEGSLHTLHRTSVDFEANVELAAREDPENESLNLILLQKLSVRMV